MVTEIFFREKHFSTNFFILNYHSPTFYWVFYIRFIDFKGGIPLEMKKVVEKMFFHETKYFGEF